MTEMKHLFPKDKLRRGRVFDERALFGDKRCGIRRGIGEFH